MALPKLVAFDLDATLWCAQPNELLVACRIRAWQALLTLDALPAPPASRIPEMYELSGPPFKVDPADPKFLLDRSGERIRLMGPARQVLAELATHARWSETQVRAGRRHCPGLCRARRCAYGCPPPSPPPRC